MDTNVATMIGGRKFNRWDEEIIPCRLCGGPTTMPGTRLCDRCWELERRVQADPELARKILRTPG
jgi:hypothetical protein